VAIEREEDDGSRRREENTLRSENVVC